jgi:hypothetical protein
MSSVPHKARVAVILGALVVAVATTFATAVSRPGVARAADITCESKTGGGTKFYDGPSASTAYDTRFGDGPPVPGLSTHTPQGVSAWFNWDGSDRDLLLVTAYHTGSDAHLIGIDPKTGKHVGTVAIADSHVGGVTTTKGWAFVSGEGQSIRKYRLSTLAKKMKQAGTPYMKQTGKARNVYGASFISSYGDQLYAGRFNEHGKDKMYRYQVNDDGSLTTRQGAYEVPKKTQGLLVANTRFIYSTSYGNDNRSNLYVVDGGARTITPGTAKCFRSPSMSEGIGEYGGAAYVVYESGAAPYVAKHPRNVIKRLHAAPIGRLTSYG